jgi:peroxiredoxin Q/BCP
MSQLSEGMSVPDFSMNSTEGRVISNKELLGQKYIIYFYPKDDTPGCTKEACDFRDNLLQLNTLGTKVIGVSKDSLEKHKKFISKYDLNFALAVDEDGSVCENFGVWVEKSMYGKTYMGIERSTFLVDSSGKILKIWRKVKVKGHIESVLEELSNLQNAA